MEKQTPLEAAFFCRGALKGVNRVNKTPCVYLNCAGVVSLHKTLAANWYCAGVVSLHKEVFDGSRREEML